MVYVIYNPLSNNRRGELSVKSVIPLLDGVEYKIVNGLAVENGTDFANNLKENDEIILCGGDGTLNHFVNETYQIKPKQNIYYYPCGSGNDFAHDVNYDFKKKRTSYKELILLNPYMQKLPVITVNNFKRYFINGIGYGIDGYCCEAGDEIRAKSTKQVNYTKIAIKGLLGKYKPANARVTVDGVVKEYKKVWLCPVMIGKFYGGGMMIAPTQKRLSGKNTVCSVVWSGVTALKTLIVFPKIFSGKHITQRKLDVRYGHEIEVEFDRATALQIDGETVRNVTQFSVQYL